MTISQKETLVTDVIEELGLSKARYTHNSDILSSFIHHFTRYTIIGDEKLRGISGGERKRV